MQAKTLFVVVAMVLVAACSNLGNGQTSQVDDYYLTLVNDPGKLQVGKDAEFTLTIEKDDESRSGCRPQLRQHLPNHQLSTDHVWHPMESLDSGQYRARSSEFSMGGDWEVEVQFNCGDGVKNATFSYQLVWM